LVAGLSRIIVSPRAPSCPIVDSSNYIGRASPLSATGPMAVKAGCSTVSPVVLSLSKTRGTHRVLGKTQRKKKGQATRPTRPDYKIENMVNAVMQRQP